MPIDCLGFSPIVIPGIKLLAVDHQLAMEQVQLFDPGMAVGRILGAGCEAYQHTDPTTLRIGRK